MYHINIEKKIIPDNEESKTENMNVLTITQSNTREILIIDDENSASNNNNQSELICKTQNPDNKNETNN